MRVTPLMIVTALAETGIGLLLLAWPALVFALLFGWRQAARRVELRWADVDLKRRTITFPEDEERGPASGADDRSACRGHRISSAQH